MDATAAAFTPGQFHYGFSAMAPSYEPESMQTRAADDLFDDDFTPIEHTAFAAAGQAMAIPFVPSADSQPSAAAQHAAQVSDPITNGTLDSNGDAGTQSATQDTTDEADPTVANTGASSTGPKRSPANEPRVHAVRGNRLATGGNQKPKLSEDELAAKMSELKLKNANREAAFARAQADAESFAQREEHAATVPKEERKNRQQMMGEREKNRQRKLKAQGGREWDLEKDQDDFNGHNDRRGARRGAHGGVVSDRKTNDSGLSGSMHASGDSYDNSHEYMYREPRGRGRGGRARGGRGGRADAAASRPQAPPPPSSTTTFPGLPKSNNNTTQVAPAKAPTLTFPNKRTDKTDKIDSIDTTDKTDQTDKSDQNHTVKEHESDQPAVASVLPPADTESAARSAIEPTRSWAEMMEK